MDQLFLLNKETANVKSSSNLHCDNELLKK